METSLDLSVVPVLSFAPGTSESTVFFLIDLHGSGSFENTAGSTVGVADTVGEALADGDASFSPSESEEQPAATSITGTAAQARMRESRGADRCMVPSLMGRLITGR
ncbi:hypothetical protein GCM10010446_36160 [Streptomyces enissocaesilis]|uniref:Uncharacterized protein n=1 Tax=Streptomyces enissocaesilis TaxID=332589 RepID=A0ABP6JTW9_9ACTN